MKHVLEAEELEEPLEIRLEERDGFVELCEDTEERTVFPWFIRQSGLLPEAFQMSMASQVPYFFQSILAEAGVDFSYTEVEGVPWEPDREYYSGVTFYLRRKDIAGLFEQFRRTGAFGIYDVFFELPEDRRISYGFRERAGFEGLDTEELEDKVAAFRDRLDTAADE
ncbi:MAG: hypothetical protein SVU32_00555 [Candidatus Nanohaloarchaea archaeon]|nr:hypothetical protein [Candidatus Nanohaloarchaea archaeon]